MLTNSKFSLEMYQNGEIGLKKVWLLSGLTFIDFIGELKMNDIEPPIPKEIDDYTEEMTKKLKF